MAGLDVSSVKMGQQGKETIENAGQLTTYINTLISAVEDLGTVWTAGGGRDTFFSEFEKEKEDLQTFASDMNRNGENISTASGILRQSDEDVSADAGRLGNMGW